MLVLTRKRNESIIINDDIEITVIDIQNDQVRIGITAPKDVSIYRKELYTQILEENKKAVESKEVSLDELKKKLEG
ncbi:MAG: carbon storage regulator CsrA [Deltaproteobacteria bacterium]